MNFKTFGTFLIAVASIILLAGGYFYADAASLKRQWNEAWDKEMRVYSPSTALNSPEVRSLQRKEEIAKERGFWIVIVGGSLFVLGVGIVLSAKKPEEDVTEDK